ncbi:MAG: J domain-containing protein, partial [Myxococcaceae bacterium]
GSGNRVRYFRCASCHRWVSSAYTEVFRADTKVRSHRISEPEKEEQFEAVKDRLERWLQALDDQDPYRALGVSPMDSAETVRAKYHELALQNHPDRGGSPEKMRELNLAYERIVSHRERRKSEALSAGSTSASLPEAIR